MSVAVIRLNVSGVITNRGDTIQFVHSDSAEAVLLVFGFNRVIIWI